MRYLYTLILLVCGVQPLLLHAQSGPSAAHTQASSAAGSVSATFGQVFYITLDGCGGTAQPGVQQPEFPALNRQSILEATDTSDAFITVSWEVLEECFKNVGMRCMPYPDGVLVELLAEGKRIYSEIVYDANGLLTNSYRHFVGPDSTVNFTLNLFIRGSGSMACTSLSATGSTLPFQPPVNFMASQGTHPGRVELSWVNKSQLSSTFLVYRIADGDSTLIASVPGTERVDTAFIFVDAFTIGGGDLNLINGRAYDYCLRTFNDPLDRTLPQQVCASGSTSAIGLIASLVGTDAVALDWANVAAFAQQINVRRNGTIIANLPPAAQSFLDSSPTFGRISTYQIDLLDSAGVARARSMDTVAVPAIGRLSGYVRTPLQVGIEGIPISYTTRIGNDTVRATVLTDYTGLYVFDSVYYDRQAIFSIRAQNQGRFTFPNNFRLLDTLNNLKPRSSGLDFVSLENYPASKEATLTIDSIQTESRIDELAFTWGYSPSANLEAPIHFQLYREGQLIGITDDGLPGALELIDRGGTAGYIYQYRLVAYGFKEDSLVRDSRMLFDTMPEVQPPYGLMAVNDFDTLSNNLITLLWNHDSDNFDGFRLYRSGELIAILAPSARLFYDYYAAPGGVFDYTLTAFRQSLGQEETLESTPAVAPGVSIPSLPQAQNLQAQPLPLCNGVELSWSLPAAPNTYDNLSGFVIFRDGVPIKRVLKRGQNYLYRDYQGRPGQMTEYAVSPYLAAVDTSYIGTGQQAAIAYPVIAMPAIASVAPQADGFLFITIDPAYQQQHCNFDGFVLSANGQPFDTLLPYQSRSYYTPNLPGGQANVNIELRAFRAFSDGFAFSEAASATGSVAPQAGSPLQAPTGFAASSHIPMHVALRWDYPDFIFSEFSIYRDGSLLEVLPTGARFYYDRTAVAGQLHVYTIQASYLGDQSTKAHAAGIRKGRLFAQGQIVSHGYTADLHNVAVDLRNAADSTFLLRTFTDSSGYFRFERLHPLVGTGDWRVSVESQGGGHVLNVPSLLLSSSNRTRALFLDQFPLAAVPPLPYRDSLARFHSFQVRPFADEQAMSITWSHTEGRIGGSELRRGLSELAAVPKGSPGFLLDTLGRGGITYPYQATLYTLEDGEKVLQPNKRNQLLDAIYPELSTVEYLSGLPGLNGQDNTITLQWSHATGKVDYYEILRNNLPLGQVPANSTLSFVDVTGKPDQRYIYQVRAARSNSSGLGFSEPRTVELVFPEIARPIPFDALGMPDSNAVLLTWGYRGEVVDGFRILRDGEVIANVPGSSRSYNDYSGVPFSHPTYHIVALLNRDGMPLQSRTSKAEADYPPLRAPYQVTATTQMAKGFVELAFRYRARGVNEFRIDRVGPGNTRTELGFLPYQHNGTEQSFAFADRSGTPGVSYTYEIFALSQRGGLNFSSAPGSVGAGYPAPPAPTGLFATTDFSNWIDLGWNLPLDANVDGFFIYRQNAAPLIRDTFQVVNPGRRTYRDAFFTLTGLPINGIAYEIAAYRQVGGQLFVSSPNPAANGRVSNPGLVSQLTAVEASKGTFANRTRVAWVYGGDLGTVDEFRVFRDAELIATVQRNINFFNDSDGVPGRQYVYTVRAVVSNVQDQGRSDIGFTPGSGQLEGEVITLQGSAAVVGAKLVAEATVEGERYRYETLTDNNGQYILSGLYVGENPANYTLSVSYLNHRFLEPVKNFTLSPQNSTRANIIFFDATAFAVTGVVRYAGTDCAIDSARVLARHFLADGTSFVEATETDRNGRYSLILKSNEPGLQRIRIEIDSLFRRNQGTPNEQVILHRFQPLGPDEIAMPIPRLTTLDFADTLTYPVEIRVRNVCGFAASSNGRFTIEVTNRDGCFLRAQQTSLTGTTTLRLPPLRELSARVVSATPLSLENNLIVNYLEYRPTPLDLEALHIANGRFDDQGVFGLEVPDTMVQRTLVYHKPAMITLASEFGMRPSCDPTQPRVINQGESYSLAFSITENHQGASCDVTEGYMIINNSAATVQRTRIDYDSTLNGFPALTFVAGTPNLVAPFRKGINIQYFSSIGDLLAERTIPVVVLGSDVIPGSDIIVDPTDEEGQLKYPVVILRDPPGDGSYSYIEEGQTITKSYADVSSFRLGGGLVTDLKIGSKVGVFVTASILGGGGEDIENTRELSFTTQQRIETSSTSDFVGPDADVLVGVGISTQYGITETIEFVEATCSFRKRQEIAIAPEGIQTDWFYTVGQIKQLVQERQNDIDSVRAGTKTIVRGGVVQPTQLAILQLEAEAFNWQQVLRYHQVTTVPYYSLCAEVFDAQELRRKAIAEIDGTESAIAALFTDFNARVAGANDARKAFCEDPAVNIMPGDTSATPQAVREIIFTSSLQEKYERSSRGVRYWLDSLLLSSAQIESRLETPAVEVFPEASNTTFSAGVNIERAEVFSRSKSSLYQQRGYLDISVAAGALVIEKINVGLGFTTLLFQADTKIGAQFNADAEWGIDRYNSNASEYTVGYVLSDDDPGDQFSVTIIRPRVSGHTPYFQLLGGRSSCPPEPGAIQRDRFDLKLYDPETQATFKFQELREIDPDENAVFYLQMTNLNPFGEQRDLYVYHEGESNTNGATVILAGQYVGGGNEDGLAFTFINPNQPVILPLELERPVNRYQFDSIFIVLRPSCTDGDLFLTGERDTVTISAFFRHPCSDITIAAPGNDWLIRRRNPFEMGSREALVLELRDYDPDNPGLQEVYLEYRRIGDGSGWRRVPASQLEPDFVLDAEALANYNAENFGPAQIPKLFLTWDITELYNEYRDGIYEIRAIAFCGPEGLVQSNIIRGQIRRQTGDLFALTKPANGVWLVGDEISIRINKDLDCSRVGEMKFELANKVTGIPVPGNFFCFSDNNTLVFQPDDQILLNYDRQDLVATVYDLVDEAGNRYPDTFRWEFRVISRDIYLDETLLRTTIYQGSQTVLSTTAFRNTPAAIGFSVEELQNYPWLMADPSSPPAALITSPLGRKINFTIDGSMLPLGDTAITLTILSTSGLINQGFDTVRIEVKVLAKPPNWVVDPSQFSQNMTAITNFAFTDAPATTSRDTMDLMSAWIDGRIRGVAPITGSGGGLFAAFMAIFGNPEDIGKPIEFRVWDASEGEEYNAYPNPATDTVFYASNSIVGTFLNPKILQINKATDRARYIPLNGNGRWTWFSINHQEPDMSVDVQLRALLEARNGDLIKTATTSASFVPGIGWLSVNGLNTLRPQDGYQIFLNGPNDTIRVTGMDASYGLIPLAQGWNLVGYPLQEAQPINPTLNVMPATQGDFIKTVAQNPLLPGLSVNMFAEYSAMAAQWLFGSTAMELLRPNFAYQIRVGQNATLQYPGATTTFTSTVTDGPAAPAAIVCDPNNPATWAVDPGLYPSNMIAVGILELNGQQSFNPEDKVAAFINGECRGVSPLYEVSALGQYMVNLFIYGEPGDGEVEIRIYDSSADRIYLNQEPFTFSANALVGNFAQPYVFRNKLFSASFEVEHTLCQAGRDGSARISLITGLEQPYSYIWSNGAETPEATGLAAGMHRVTITGQGGLWFSDSVRVENLMQEIALPQVSASFEGPVCRGDEAAFYASGNLDGATYLWSDAQGDLLYEGASLVLDGLQAAFAGYVQTAHRGCYSAPVPIAAPVYQPEAGFYVTPSEELTTATELRFEPQDILPGAQWHWDFGDGNTSTEPEPAHRYAQPGEYEVTLAVIDATGCRNTASLSLAVESLTKTLELVGGQLTLEAWPNPFNSLLRAKAAVTEAGRYRLSLLDMEGRLIWSESYQWTAGEHEAELRLSIPDATYLLRLENESGGMMTIPAIKQTPRP